MKEITALNVGKLRNSNREKHMRFFFLERFSCNTTRLAAIAAEFFGSFQPLYYNL